MVKRILSGLSVLSLLFASRARAEGPPQVHHAPPAVAPANEPLSISATIDGAEGVDEASVVYRTGNGEIGRVPFRRSSDERHPYVAVIPAEAMRMPSLAYAIEVESNGERKAVFASQAKMHGVALNEDASDARERALLARLGGRRTTLGIASEVVRFGSSPTTLDGTPREQSDQFFRIEGQFTYRLLGTISEFGLRGGIVRGSSPVPGATRADQFDVGMNYAAPRLRLRASDFVHIDGEALTSVNEIGYSVGGGGALLLGDAYGTHLTLGFEGIRIFGMRGYARYDVAVSRRLALGTTIEVTNQPHANDAGVRLIGDVKVDLGAGFAIGLRGGYQARAFASGGPSGGLLVAYSF